jgi:hypothetical protein
MWTQAQGEEGVLLLRIHSKEQRVFTFSVDYLGRSGLTPVSRVDREYTIDLQTQEQLRSLLRGLIERPDGQVQGEGFSRLGQLLFSLVLPDWVQDELLRHPGAVLVQASDVGLPWEVLHDGHSFLCLRKPFSRRLVEADFAVRTAAPTSQGRSMRALIVADAQDDLPTARQEAEELRQMFQDRGVETTLLQGSRQAKWDVVLQHLAGKTEEHQYAIVHLSGHVQEDAGQNGEVYRYFVLANGTALSPEHIVRSFGCPETLVFINACFGHPVETVAAEKKLSLHMGGRARSLLSAFLSHGGCRGVIGTMWWVMSHVAHSVSRGFYLDVLNGTSVGDALLHARQHIAQQCDDPAVWAGYVHYGDPRITLMGTDRAVRPPNELPSPPPGGTPPQSPPPAPPSESPPRTVEPQAPAPTEIDQENLPPLDETGRLVLVKAFHEQQQRLWPELSTIHILIGMLQIEKGAARRLIEQANLSVSELVRLIRECLRDNEEKMEQADRKGGKVGIRSNVVELLNRAYAVAKSKGRGAVSEADLLWAVVSMPKSGAYVLLELVLDATGQSLGDLLQKVQPGEHDATERKVGGLRVFRADGEVDFSVMADTLRDALERAMREAACGNWSEIRSPHLALGILTCPKSEMKAYAQRRGLPIQRFVSLLRAVCPPGPAETPPRLHKEFVSDNALQYLHRAVELARRRDAVVVGEQDLWRAILEDPRGIVVAALLKGGFSPAAWLPTGW